MEIRGAKPGSGYAATWFDPRSGATRKAAAVTATAAGRLPLPSRPDGEDWLVILRAAR